MYRQLTINEKPYGVCIIFVSFTTQRYDLKGNYNLFESKYWKSLTKRLLNL